MIGQTFSHYRVLEKLGTGGMGIVYKAQDLRLERYVTLKFLPDILIIHRDIKPAYIFVTKRGQAKVLDFGLAKLISKRDGDTDVSDSSHPGLENPISIVGVISGTPSYMSPEQIRGDDLDVRADVFSLGLLLYEMATGQKAFPGNTGGVIIAP